MDRFTWKVNDFWNCQNIKFVWSRKFNYHANKSPSVMSVITHMIEVLTATPYSSRKDITYISVLPHTSSSLRVRFDFSKILQTLLLSLCHVIFLVAFSACKERHLYCVVDVVILFPIRFSPYRWTGLSKIPVIMTNKDWWRFYWILLLWHNIILVYF